jgi:hypothetical protein
MLAKLTRIVLAIATAFVFTGQMEAAAQHCARLALASQAAAAHHAEAETPPCHDAPAAEQVQSHHAAPHHTTQHQHPSPDHCECIAALKMCVALPAATASTHIEPYAWALPQAAAFASTQPAPDWRPPRA